MQNCSAGVGFWGVSCSFLFRKNKYGELFEEEEQNLSNLIDMHT